MKIKRVKKAFRTGGVVPGVRGMHEGDLVPDNHPLVKRLPSMFEDVEAYVARQYPGLCGNGTRRGLLGKAKNRAEPPADETDEPATPVVTPERPPPSGPGSGVDQWRRYAAEVTQSPVESWSTRTRDEIIEQLDSEGAGHGQE